MSSQLQLKLVLASLLLAVAHHREEHYPRLLLTQLVKVVQLYQLLG